MWQFIKTYLGHTRGATAIEYSLIVGGIALAISTAVFVFGGDVTELFQYALDRFNERPE